MPNKIERRSSVTSSITANALSTCPRIPYSAVAGGIVIVTATSGAATIQWQVAATAEGTAYSVYSGGSAVTTTISANQAYPIPDALFAAPYIVPATDAGTATIIVTLKG